jgi:hypothetical protein
MFGRNDKFRCKLEKPSDPLYGTTEVQTDGCLCVMEMDVRFYVLISGCEDDRNRRIFASSFGPKVNFAP